MSKIYINDILVKPTEFFDLDSKIVEVPNVDTEGASLSAEQSEEKQSV